MPDPLAWLQDAMLAWESRGLRRQPIVRESPQYGATFVCGGREYLNFGSNDYLGLAASAELIEAARASLAHAGFGAGASPLVTGRGALHAQLEQALAEFEGTEAALLFPTGYAANVGAITALVSPGDAIFSDAKNHASIIDGCRLSGAAIHVYPHNEVAALAEMLAQHASSARRRLIVTDALFSMDGDLAPLRELVALAERYDCMLIVDEAHATGVFGTHGRGVCEHLGVEDRVPIRVGTLSKALGAHGGFVSGSQLLIDWIANRARPYIFSTAAPEALAAAALKGLEIVRSQPQRREQLLNTAAQLRATLRQFGFRVPESPSQIIPVMLGDPQRTMDASQALRDRGLWVPGIRPPSVPEGQSLLRISLTSAHTPAMLERLVAALLALAHGENTGR